MTTIHASQFSCENSTLNRPPSKKPQKNSDQSETKRAFKSLIYMAIKKADNVRLMDAFAPFVDGAQFATCDPIISQMRMFECRSTWIGLAHKESVISAFAPKRPSNKALSIATQMACDSVDHAIGVQLSRRAATLFRPNARPVRLSLTPSELHARNEIDTFALLNATRGYL